jgi:superfamily II DNA/RNA helicase
MKYCQNPTLPEADFACAYTARSYMVFVNRKHDADKVARMLCQRKHTAVSIHGDKLQDERMRVLSQFTRGQAQIIVCTDVAARGLDIKGVSHVVNYDLPFSGVEDWVHRVGRTGRAGVKGTAHTFVRYARSCESAEIMTLEIESEFPSPLISFKNHIQFSITCVAGFGGSRA